MGGKLLLKYHVGRRPCNCLRFEQCILYLHNLPMLSNQQAAGILTVITVLDLSRLPRYTPSLFTRRRSELPSEWSWFQTPPSSSWMNLPQARTKSFQGQHYY
eukprot:1967102-Amphidinium_carterae.1